MEMNWTSRITASNVNNPNADLLHGRGFIYKSQVRSKAYKNGTRIADDVLLCAPRLGTTPKPTRGIPGKPVCAGKGEKDTKGERDG